MSRFDQSSLWLLMLDVAAARRKLFRAKLSGQAQFPASDSSAHPLSQASDSSTHLPSQASDSAAVSRNKVGRNSVQVAEQLSRIETLTQTLQNASQALVEWQASNQSDEPAQYFHDLYISMLGDDCESAVVIGHLGQSLEACISTASGDSRAMTGAANHRHLHRMRALCDAIVVGGNTAALDDPQLNTRLVKGDSPVRVIIDPELRLRSTLALWDDGAAINLIACTQEALHEDKNGLASALQGRRGCEVLAVPEVDGALSLPDLFNGLRQRGLQCVFVEGGGITVSRCLQAGVLSRLQITSSAVLVGQGHRALQLPAISGMDAALRPSYRLFRMGDDVLWDLDVSSTTSVTDRFNDVDEMSAGLEEIERLL